MEQFNQLCYDFQLKILDTFNSEQQIPFLLKYYLFKEIWENIEQAVARDKRSHNEVNKSQQPQSQENNEGADN